MNNSENNGITFAQYFSCYFKEAVLENLKRENQSNRILLIENNDGTLKSLLTLSNFTVLKMQASENIYEIAGKYMPHLILTSYEEIESTGIVEKIRESQQLAHTPIIVIANSFNISNAIKNLNGNVDDYIVKPFQPEELTARIWRIINRHQRVLNSNPLTKLPGNFCIKSEIEDRLEAEEEFCVCYADLDNFKSFNDYYGYEKGDSAIKLTGDIVRETLNRHDTSGKSTFLGHIGGDDFIFITPVETVKRICEDVINGFDQKILSLYSKKDLKNGWIVSFDRNGSKSIFPIMTISIAVVVSRKGQRRHFGEFSQVGAELKKYVKSLSGSNYIIDRRGTYADASRDAAEQGVPVLRNRINYGHFDKKV
jgi:diguanylate cyclase (GGDEF)-like protein